MKPKSRSVIVQGIRILVAVALCALPLIAQGSLFSWLGLTGQNPKDVATKVASLHVDGGVHGLAFSPDGRYLATSTPLANLLIHIWDWRTGRIVRTIKKLPSGDAGVTEPLRFSPNGRLLALCAGALGHVVIQVWNPETGAVVHDIPNANPHGSTDCQSIAFSPDGRRLFAVFDRNTYSTTDSLIAYSTRTWQPVWGLPTPSLQLTTLAVSPDGRFLAAGGMYTPPRNSNAPGSEFQARIAIVDVARHAIVRRFTPFSRPFLRLNQLAWSPDGVHLAAGPFVANPGPDDAVRIFDARTGALVTRETTPKQTGIFALRYTPNGQYLIESAIGGHIRIWDGQHQHLLQQIDGVASSLAVSADSRYLAMGGTDKVLVWKLKQAQPIHPIDHKEE